MWIESVASFVFVFGEDTLSSPKPVTPLNNEAARIFAIDVLSLDIVCEDGVDIDMQATERGESLLTKQPLCFDETLDQFLVWKKA